MSYKEEIEQLEADCDVNFETAFNTYLLMDIEENGGVKELFTDMDLYCFWLEKGYRINFILNELLYSPEQKDLALKAVKIKRIIDASLLKYGKSEKEILEDLALQEIKGNSEIIEIKFQGENKDNFLKAFHKQLVEDGYIECSFDLFSNHFVNGKKVAPINWIGKQKVLLGIIKSFNNIIILKKRTLTKLITQHFLFDGEPINIGSVESTLPAVQVDNGILKKYSNIQSKFLI